MEPSPTPPPVLVAPSLLAADFSNIAAEVRRAGQSGADWLHLDVMDGHFVDNISFGPAVIAAVRDSQGGLPLDTHLMISRPDHYLDRFLQAGSDGVTVHVEADHDVSETLRRIRAAGKRAGLALNPATDFATARAYLGEIDLLLCMTVVPGFGGQAFLREVLPKIREAAAARTALGLSYHIQVDGGVDAHTAAECLAAGANVLVAGSSTFRAPDMKAAVAAIRQAGAA